MEALSLENVEMLDTVENCLSIFFGGISFSLKINHKAMKLIKGDGVVFGIHIKHFLDIFRRLCYLEPEYSSETEADLERLLSVGHLCQ